jgi:hypothetical protein
MHPSRVGLDVPIEAKLHAPSWRREWVERPELTDYLARAASRLGLVDAPAGFGKTTVVAQWRASAAEGRRFAWVSLDHGDDDPARLWWYIGLWREFRDLAYLRWCRRVTGRAAWSGGRLAGGSGGCGLCG